MTLRKLLLVSLFTVSVWPALTFAQATLTTLYYFQGGSDGKIPFGLALDSSGVLYGLTSQGGASSACRGGCGTVFSLTPPASPGDAWTKTELYSFSGGSDGGSPSSALLIGSGGALYGTTSYGGSANAGTVYSLQPPSVAGGPWTESVLYSFTSGPDGGDPESIAMASNGIFYGTARSGGAGSGCTGGCGTVFSLTPPASPGGVWTETALYSFLGGSDGYAPKGIIVGGGASGLPVLYGPTIFGGSYTNGTVFSLTPPASPGGVWSHSVLASFNSIGAVVAGAGGVLYGSTTGGGTHNGGSVFSLTPPASPGGAWGQTILHSFRTCSRTSSCDEPTGLYYDNMTGILYGLTIFGGGYRAGSVYSLTPPTAPGGSWTYSVVQSFNQSDGADPDSLVITGGVFYGTTAHKGSAAKAGTVFSLQP